MLRLLVEKIGVEPFADTVPLEVMERGLSARYFMAFTKGLIWM